MSFAEFNWKSLIFHHVVRSILKESTKSGSVVVYYVCLLGVPLNAPTFAVSVTQAWESETSLCKAFAIGKTEAKAVMQLHSGMDPKIRDLLEEAVRLYGMRPFIYHDVIAKECFSRGFSSATSGFDEWSQQLTNGAAADDPLVPHPNITIIGTW